MNESELDIMRNSFKTVYNKRKNILKDPQVKILQENVINIKEDSINHNKELINVLKDSFNKNDIDYAFADTDEEARKIIYDIIIEEDGNESNAKLNDENLVKNENSIVVAKSKSNTLGEISASKFLQSKGIDVVETDLGDRILQLKGKNNKPTHPTGPASHLNVEKISEIVSNGLGVDVAPNPKAIMEVVRKDVLAKLSDANIGLSGANAVASEDGSLVFIHNEGNISLISLMKTHIIVVGIEKLVRTIEDAISIAKLETIYATGSKVTSYINIVSGPSKTADIEKKLLKNMYGAERVFVIILDNGRSQAIQSIGECLYCIGCGSCIVTCPVYNVIGNDFGFNNYLGGRGVAMSKFIQDTKTSISSGLYKCTLCGLCRVNCPVSISISDIIENLRFETHKSGLYPPKHEKFKDNIKNKGSPY